MSEPVSLDRTHPPSGLSDRFARGFTLLLRFFADTFFAQRYRHRAIEYWNLSPDARLTDVIIAVRADEAGHRDVNHAFADQLGART